MPRALRVLGISPLILAAALAGSGCNLVPRQELEECHRLSQTLRSENATLKNQMLALRSQNQDFSERAMDDERRLAQLEASNEQLETSVQAYQDERSRLETAFKELRDNLPNTLRSTSSQQLDEQPSVRVARRSAKPTARPDAASSARLDADLDKASGSTDSPKTRSSGHRAKGGSSHGIWSPAKVEPTPARPADSSSPVSNP